MKVFSANEWLEELRKSKHPAQASYRVMYSSYVNGFIKDAGLMMVPVDDHLVHRGDGVFEAIKFSSNGIYLLEAHLKRLMESAAKIELKSEFDAEKIRSLILQTVKLAELPKGAQGIIRIFFSRGPGNFSPNPYDSMGGQLYIIVTDSKAPSADSYAKGVRLGKSQIAVKTGWMAQVKSCNYLVNVMMKKEAVDRGLDFTVGMGEDGFITEGPTENIILIDQEGALRFPSLKGILRGTTMMRLVELIEQKKLMPVKPEKSFNEEDIKNAKEIFMIGTTLDILPVSRFENHTIPVGSWGPKLLQLLKEDQQPGSPVTVPF